ncbi:phosphate regulon sensor histidine kinase PhoR [Phyllobacterium myrsinacearum]|uniref:Phosphate regulon sensor protein PhoR n=1 Tax=Phyllobacterium myrsinacearum TaxID=28101 RepID=A0A2S9JCG2_9HYPH|nr:phosphate regulon sensor histidine kinase PhoR [Phyllobacterium myrsinacearum]PRD50492.1 phosphate regulon sensor histidine kinase PhoR [Phyllobacterium myrsinacearum]PWV94972.1 two-component system phosphate regulon sensor histidine kinase PhoR [Phyllobacterium myrsinacearum]RZV06917.1 two-component system phosphate regulon sensor histidine kinase PhoR [Phyllobacterium myrsinacearum]
MSIFGSGRESRGLRQRAMQRIIRARYILGAAAFLTALVLNSGASWWLSFAILMLLLLGVVALSASIPRIDDTNPALPVSDPAIFRLSGQQLAAQLPDPLIIFDHEGTILYVNPAANGAFGPLARGGTLLLHFRAPEMQTLVQSVMSDAQAGSIDYSERVPVERWYRATVLRLDQGGSDRQYLLSFRDLTEAHRLERMRSDFIANASHELRTPLASLSGFIETLRGPARNDAVARDNFLEIMQKQAERMARLIDDLLSLSRIEMKAHIAVKDQVDLTTVLNHVVDTLRPLATHLDIEIERHIDPGPVMVLGDRDELTQVFQNLLENACKYGQSGKKVVVELKNNGEGIKATVQDFGPGIPEEHIPRLTERFYRVNIETSRAQKGTGLGLAIVKHILTRHRARLVVRSRVGEGSSFTVAFGPQKAKA